MNTYAFYTMKYTSVQMLVTFTDPTIYDVRRDLVPHLKLSTRTVQSLHTFFGQTDDGPHTGPKHDYVYIYIYTHTHTHTLQLCIIDLTQRG